MIKKSYIKHMMVLRTVLLRFLVMFLALFSVLVFFANDLYQLLAKPLIKILPNSGELIATGVIAPIMVPLKFALFVAFIVAIPFLFIQLWKFIAPGLYPSERQSIWPFLLLSTGLFYLGMLFAYFIVFPLVFSFIAKITPIHVTLMPDISEYLSFCMQLLLVFGFSFEVPILVLLISKTGLVDVNTIQSKRSFVIVGAFVIGMLLTPPDVISQILLAIPLWLLFELGVWLAIRGNKGKSQKEFGHRV